MAVEITDSNFQEILNSGKPVMVDFWAQWCGPCLAMGPVIEELAKDYDGQIVVGKLDVDNNPAVSNQFGIRNIPTILFFKDGKVVDKQVGAVPKTVLVKKLDAQLD
jgi:thioredoxin 1